MPSKHIMVSSFYDKFASIHTVDAHTNNYAEHDQEFLRSGELHQYHAISSISCPLKYHQ